MPFIKPERRLIIDDENPKDFSSSKLGEIQPGDICYSYYKPMVEKWRVNPRWTTAHEIYRDMISHVNDNWGDTSAYNLAWQVFFNLYVMPYELKKREENGDI